MEPARLKRKHELKTWPKYFKAILCCEKTFEVRKNDRDFQPYEILVLREWDPETEDYTGRSLDAAITYVLHGGQFGIEAGYVVMGINHLYHAMCSDCDRLGEKCPSCANLITYGMDKLKEYLEDVGEINDVSIPVNKYRKPNTP